MPVLETCRHERCRQCGSPSVPLEGLADQSLRECPGCGEAWYEEQFLEELGMVDDAERLADELEECADAVRKAAYGDPEAKAFLQSRIDGHWFALVIGRGVVQRLAAEDNE